MHSILEKPLKSETRTPKKVLYVGIPYAIRPDIMQDASVKLMKFFGETYKPDAGYSFIPTNALISIYKSPELTNSGRAITDKTIYSLAKPLLDAAAGMLILRYPGWEYSEILVQEAAYMSVLNKPITYADPY